MTLCVWCLIDMQLLFWITSLLPFSVDRGTILTVSSLSQKTLFASTNVNSAYSLLDFMVWFSLLLVFIISCPVICLCIAQVHGDWILEGLKCMPSYRTGFPLRPPTCPLLGGTRCFPVCTLCSLASDTKWLFNHTYDFLHHLSPSSALRASYWAGR